MPNDGTEAKQCQVGTVSLAEAVLDCLSTGMKIPVVFVFVVVFSSAIYDASVVSGSLEVPEHPCHPVSSPPPQGPEVLLLVSSVTLVRFQLVVLQFQPRRVFSHPSFSSPCLVWDELKVSFKIGVYISALPGTSQ